MTTFAEHIIVAGAENRPPMLEKSMYDSWASRIRLFIKEKKHAQQIQDDCDVQAINIMLHILSPDVYALVNHQEAAKDIWDRGETLYEYYWRLSQLINDMHTIRMIMHQVQVNTKFSNALLLNGAKFVTDVKLAKSLYTTNYDQLYAYLSQHERHANEVRIMRERYPDPLALAPTLKLYAIPLNLYNIQVLQYSGLTIPTFQQEEDPIDCINKCTQPKRPRNSAWFKEKLMLVEAQEAGQILDEEQLAFIAEPGIEEAPVSQQIIPHNSAF
ncbi:hypothetical protein Tco_1297750 [Tanacetum coccineum]